MCWRRSICLFGFYRFHHRFSWSAYRLCSRRRHRVMCSLYAHRDGCLPSSCGCIDRYRAHFYGPRVGVYCRNVICVTLTIPTLCHKLILYSLANICSMATLTALSAELTAELKPKEAKYPVGVEAAINVSFIVLTTLSHCIGVRVSVQAVTDLCSVSHLLLGIRLD